MSLRLDTWLAQHHLVESREKARLAIRQGLVRVNGMIATKPAQEVRETDVVVLEKPPLAYVSQGGLKLETAIREFGLDFQGKRILDLGASTGGFTDCALQHGAARVYAVDVGTDQLHPSLRADARVRAYEGLHVRDLGPEHLEGQPVDWIVIDVSFISLTKVLPFLPSLLAPGGQLVILVKPQFELEAKKAFKGGIVKSDKWRQFALERVLACARELGFQVKGITQTEVADPGKKNVEFLLWLG